MIFFSKNLRFLRKIKGFTQGELAHILGVKANTISNYESNASQPDIDMLIKIVKILDVDANELLVKDIEKHHSKGRVEPPSKIAPKVAPNIAPNRSPRGQLEYIEPHIPALQSQVREYDPLTAVGRVRSIPILDAQAAAGWAYSIDKPEFYKDCPVMTTPMPWFQSGEHLLIQVSGDSMHPTIYNGDWLFIRRVIDYKEIRDGYVHVVVTRDGVVCKRLLNRLDTKGYISLQSDNNAYTTYTVHKEDIVQIWAVQMRMSAILRNENLDLINKVNNIEADIAELKAGIIKKK